MIPVTDEIAIDEAELSITFIRASGPGGQNVNKVSSAAQLRFDARRSPALDDAVSTRLQKLAGSRLTLDGEIVITASRFRSQERNRADAIARLVELIRKAAVAPVARRRTRPPKAVNERRMEAKARRGATKTLRAKLQSPD